MQKMKVVCQTVEPLERTQTDRRTDDTKCIISLASRLEKACKYLPLPVHGIRLCVCDQWAFADNLTDTTDQLLILIDR